MAPSHSPNNVSFVIVPGSFVLPGLYEDNIVAQLHESGHHVQTVGLLSANNATLFPAPTAEDDAAHIRAAVLAILDDPNTPRDVVFALHSYAGIPGSTAARGLTRAHRKKAGKKTAVIGIAYLAALVVHQGASVRSTMKGNTPGGEAVPGGYLPAIPDEYILGSFNGLPEEQARKYLPFFTRHSSDSYDGGLKYEAWKDIPSTQIIPGEDLVVPPTLQEEMYQEAVAAGGKIKKVNVPGAGHAVNAVRPGLVVEEMVALAEGKC